MIRAVQLTKALADPTRLRICRLLRGREELCVCEIVDALDLPQYRVSRHLGVLKAAGVVSDWRQGKWMHYMLASSLSAPERALLEAACDCVAQEPAARLDERRLSRSLRPREKGAMVRCP